MAFIVTAPLARIRTAGIFLLAAIGISVVACGARSTMMEEPEPATSPAEATGGAAGSLVLPTGQGGQVTGGTVTTNPWSTGGAAGASQTTPATGGTAGSNGGTGGGFLGDCQYPSCIWSLIRDCHPTGQCVQDSSASSGSSTVAKLCCDDGFGESITLDETSSTLHGTLAVSKNGRKCYDVSFRATIAGDVAVVANYIWTSPTAGNVATATGTSDGSLTIVCSNGETMTMASNCSPDGMSTDPHPAEGTCK